jgi:UDP-N-acetylmuramate--alanine ligase
VRRNLVTYGLKGDADLSAADIRADGFAMNYELMVRGNKMGRIKLAVPGLHNVQNSLAAIAVGLEFDVPMASIRESLTKFTGADRRFHRIGEARGRRIVDDYAHHPTEIKVTLEAADAACANSVVAVFQPHRYSRLKHCWDRFLECFEHARHVVVLPIYSAGEEALPGIDSAHFAADLEQHHSSVSYLDDPDQLADHLLKVSREGDLVMGLGAGSISAHAKKVFQTWQS